MKTELLRSAPTAQTTSNDKFQNPDDSFSIQLWTFYEHSHLNIHTIFILNYERIIFECSPKHSWNVTWMLLCPLGWYGYGWSSVRNMKKYIEKRLKIEDVEKIYSLPIRWQLFDLLACESADHSGMVPMEK